MVLPALVSPANAFDRISFTVDQIQTKTASLEQLEISMAGIETDTPRLSLDSGLLHLPAPFNNIRQIRIQCADFVMQAGLMACKQGKGHIDWPDLASPRFDLSFDISDQGGVWKIQRLKLWGGSVDLRVTEKQWRWRLEIQGHAVDLKRLQQFFRLAGIQSLQGKVDLNIQATGHQDSLQQISLAGVGKQIDLKALNEQLLTEKNRLSLQLSASLAGSEWNWRSRLKLDDGAVFFDPVYLSFSSDRSLIITADGHLRTSPVRLKVKRFFLEQAGVVQVRGQGRLHRQLDADLRFSIRDLNKLTQDYLIPFLETGPLADLQLVGQMDANVRIKQNKFDAITAVFDAVELKQPGNHIAVSGLAGRINWRAGETVIPSFLQWHSLSVKKIPVGAGRLDFTWFDKQMALSKPAELSLLDGVFSIRKFSFQAVRNNDAKVFFEGEVNKLSLEKLTEALDWKTPLSGTISGYIPAVHYQDKTLRLDGQLAIQVFGGEIIIQELSSSGLFGFSPRLHTDISFNNLDLKQITQKFQIGRIEGRLSGFAHNVYLENWQPVTFYAWLGTPDDDDSRHLISQKAVENIASIGGGGAADVISRGFLRFFDTFGYDKLGFGCYLHDGVCQMMGVEAAENGYYLIKGGGLPRIDVIGYNPRLDWNVLIRRLQRIGMTDEIIVQ